MNTRSSVNIEQGLENAGFAVTTKSWLDRQDEKHRQARKNYLAWIPAYAREHETSELFATFANPFQVTAPADITGADITTSDSDTAIYVISRNSGEGSDRSNRRGDYLLYEEEKEQLEQLGKAYDKLIVVLNLGGVIDLSEVKATEGVNAVLLMGQLGSVGGDVLADVLTGKVNPSGKLTDTWAKHYRYNGYSAKVYKKISGKKVNVTPAKNWEIVTINYTGVTAKGSTFYKEIKNGAKLKKSTAYEIEVLLKNKKTQALERVLLNIGQKAG